MKFIILLIATSVFMTIISFVTYNQVRSPDFCVRCHVMKPEFYTWQASSHSSFACVECHVSINFQKGVTDGIKDLSNDSLSIVRNTWAYLSDDYIMPIRMTFPVEDIVCLKCHSEAREASPPGDLLIPHPIHKDKQVSCVRCHSGVAHGDIATRRVTILGSLEEWDKSEGKRQMELQYTRTPMDDCMKCHQRRSAPLDCDACHSSSKRPASHKKASFLTTHGKEAVVELDSCNLCHGYSGYVNGGQSQLKDGDKNIGLVSLQLLLPRKERPPQEIVAYARDNQFCVNCHSKKPESHDSKDFANLHASEGKKKSSSCLTCHSNRPEENNPTTKTTCASCHPSSHSKRDWKATHPVEVKGKIQASCLNCHTNSCTTCHTTLKLESVKATNSSLNAVNDFSNKTN